MSDEWFFIDKMRLEKLHILNDDFDPRYEGWLTGPIRETVIGNDTGEPLELDCGTIQRIQRARDRRVWKEKYWIRVLRDDSGMERSQAPARPANGSMALPSPVHRWSGRVELHRDGCGDHVLSQLLLEGLRAGERANRPFE